MGAFKDLSAYKITDAKVADSKRKTQKKEKRILEMVQGYDLTFELFEWYLKLPDVKKLRSHYSIVSVLRAFNNEFKNDAVNTILQEHLQQYQKKRQAQGLKPGTIDKELRQQVHTAVEKGYLNKKIDWEPLRAFKAVFNDSIFCKF